MSRKGLIDQRGFTLVEILVVIFIIGTMSAAVLFSFGKGQEGAMLTRAAAAFESDIRRAQILAITSHDFEGSTPCGYGVHYLTQRTYSVYVGKIGGAANCQSSNHNFEGGIDSVFGESKIVENKVVFQAVFPDVFFEPPDPAVYINNDKSVGASTVIKLCLETDPAKCLNLTVDTAGRIVTQ